VFARFAIKENEVIEKCPVIDIPKYDVASLSQSILLTYFYFFGRNKERMLITLGFGSIYNHAHIPNARYKENKNEKTIDFIAIQDITENEEITVNYVQGKQINKYRLWFTEA
jgi:SET domain-containing protein